MINDLNFFNTLSTPTPTVNTALFEFFSWAKSKFESFTTLRRNVRILGQAFDLMSSFHLFRGRTYVPILELVSSFARGP